MINSPGHLSVASRSGISTNKKEGKVRMQIRNPDHPGPPVSASIKDEIMVNEKNKLSVSKIFTITFNYLEKAFQIKVMEVKYSNNQAIYKTVLGSKLSKSTNMCWLQRQPQGWTLQMGNDIDHRLLKAITLAIEGRGLRLSRV